MKKKKQKPYWEMNTRELAEATKEFDQEFVLDRGSRPLNAAERGQFRRAAKRGPGRPLVGKGSARINITIERGLLAEADAIGRRENIGRSELIARGLRLLVSMRKAG